MQTAKDYNELVQFRQLGHLADMTSQEILPQGHVYLIGAGIIGREILRAHTDAGVSVWIIDQSADAVRQAINSLELANDQWQVDQPMLLPGNSVAVYLQHCDDRQPREHSIVIESIVERLDAKRAFFSTAQTWFGDDAVLCSNTSNLRISEIAEVINDPSRFAGMHFFMPVDRRPATEVVRGKQTSEATIQACCRHAQRIKKPSLIVADSPGFIVNRLLSPYLNESLLLLCRGVTGEQIERAALAYGMPMSPLELIDYIGTRTMFDAGRAFWQAFPDRLSPSPMLAGLIKRKRLGRNVGLGLYDYQDGKRSSHLADETIELSKKYSRHEQAFDDDDVVELLSVPMWIEAALARRDGITNQDEHFNLAMRGGLGYAPERNWLDFFDTMGSDRIIAATQKWSPISASMIALPNLIQALREAIPSEAIRQFSDNPSSG
ncbi:MAG: 3-hydroxyacyl-CoA dehydrogenase family protein [Rubripirellula sp.]|nr:3-hydroxyacyl-CoA dehydrogenase family protein [Rubripirellula sp.]